MEEGETAAEDVPVGNPDEVAKNPTALKGNLELMKNIELYRSRHTTKVD